MKRFWISDRAQVWSLAVLLILVSTSCLVEKAARAFDQPQAPDAPPQAAGTSRVVPVGAGFVDLAGVWMIRPGAPAPTAEAPGVVLISPRGGGGSEAIPGVTGPQWDALRAAFGAAAPTVPQPGPKPPPEKPPAGPTLAISAPAAGAKLSGATVEVKATIGGDVAKVMHWHLQLDKGPVVTLDPKVAAHTFADVPPGDHALVAWLSDPDHKDVPGSRVEVPFSTTVPPPDPLPPLSTAPVASVAVSTDLAEVAVGASTTARATARAADGTALTGRTVAWSSSEPAVATVAGGTVVGVAAGKAEIVAEVEGKSGSATITVRAAGASHEHDHGKPPDASGAARAASRSGAWSDKATWGGTLPADGDVVSIPKGMAVLYDLADGPRLPTLTVEAGGTLRYPPDRSTTTRFGTLWVAAGGTLEAGTADEPIEPDVLHEFIRLNLPLDTAAYPDALDGGLIGYGEIRIHGAPRSPTFVRLAREPQAGDTTLALAEPVSGWRPGDRLVVPGSHVWGAGNSELLTLKSISGDGKTVTLAGRLVWGHPGARDGDGKLDFLPHVANLTRNVVIRSEDPAGVRGHTIYTERCHPVIRYAEFRDLGRTRLDVLDNTTEIKFDSRELKDLDRGTAGHPLRSFVYGTEGTFRADLPNGTYDVTITLGDSEVGHDVTSVWLQDRTVAQGIGTAAGKPWEGTFPATVADGSLRVRLSGYGGTDPNFTLVSLRARPASQEATAAGKTFAFGPAGSPAPAGSVPVSTEPYTAARGFGWLSGAATRIGANQVGRYPVHYHHDLGPTDPPAEGQFVLDGCAVWSSTPEGDRHKWGIAVHASHFGLVAGNVVYSVAGGGLVTEDGTETGNVIERNFIVRVAGSQGDARNFAWGVSHEGSGIWLRGTDNVVRDNVATDCVVNSYVFGSFYQGSVRIPTAPGQSPSDYAEVAQAWTTPIREFSGNEAYGSPEGLGIWNIGVADPDPATRTLIKDLRLWNVAQVGIYFYPSWRVRLDGLVTRGDYGGQAMITGHYSVAGLEIVNSDIQGFWMGVNLPTINNEAAAPLVVENTYLRNTINVFVSTLEGQFGQENIRMPRHIILRNVRFGTPAHVTDPVHIDFPFAPQPGAELVFNHNVIEEDWIEVYDYNGAKGDDFRVYKVEQRGDYVVPATGGHIFLGAPEPGLTNAQAWAKYVRDPATGAVRLRKLPEDKDLPGIAIGGAIAPPDAARRPGIKGLVAPLKKAG